MASVVANAGHIRALIYWTRVQPLNSLALADPSVLDLNREKVRI